jgi:hypothetical protein
MMKSFKTVKTVFFDEGDIYVSDPHLTDLICECGGTIMEIGDCRVSGSEADYMTVYNCVECNQPYKVYHRKQ